MTVLSVEISHVVQPQHMRVFVPGGVINSITLNQPLVMDVYTGWYQFDFFSFDGLSRATLVLLVPLDQTTTGFELQHYPDKGDAIISASLSSFGKSPSAVAVDDASVKIETTVLPSNTKNVLVMRVDVAINSGDLNRFAYHVTVLSTTSPEQLDTSVVSVGADTVVPV